MSYRYRFAKVKKNTVADISNQSRERFIEYLMNHNPKSYCEEEDYINTYDCFGQEEIFDFGSDCRFADTLVKQATPIFSDEMLFEETGKAVLCSKEDFLFVIEQIRKIILDYFKELQNGSVAEMKQAISDKVDDWEHLHIILGVSNASKKQQQEMDKAHLPYNISMDTDMIVNSWKYEYEIFELVRLYKTFDWDKYELIFYGW